MLALADSAVARRPRKEERARSPAAVCQRKVRQNRKRGMHHYGLWISDRAVEGMPARPRTVPGRLISLGGIDQAPPPLLHAPAPPPSPGPQPDRRRARRRWMTVISRGFQCAPVLGLRSLQLPCPRALVSRGAPRLRS